MPKKCSQKVLRKGCCRHLARTLQQKGFLPENVFLPECINTHMEKALEKFLSSERSRDIRVVINAFRTIQADSFVKRRIKPVDWITPGVKAATREFIVKYHSPSKCSVVSEMDMMEPWELTG